MYKDNVSGFSHTAGDKHRHPGIQPTVGRNESDLAQSAEKAALAASRALFMGEHPIQFDLIRGSIIDTSSRLEWQLSPQAYILLMALLQQPNQEIAPSEVEHILPARIGNVTSQLKKIPPLDLPNRAKMHSEENPIRLASPVWLETQSDVAVFTSSLDTYTRASRALLEGKTHQIELLRMSDPDDPTHFIDLTMMEQMLFLLIIMHEKIAFKSTGAEKVVKVEPRVSQETARVHFSNLNKKINRAFGLRPVIFDSRFGVYTLHNRS